MILEISKLKSIPPQEIIKRELSKREMSQRYFAHTVNEHPQTINAILKGKRKITIGLALKIEKLLGWEEGFISILQTYYEIEQEKNKNRKTPNLNIITNGLFWDIDLAKLDWEKYANFVILRTFERGSEAEKKEITQFYGKEMIEKVLLLPKRQEMKIYKNITPNAVL